MKDNYDMFFCPKGLGDEDWNDESDLDDVPEDQLCDICNQKLATHLADSWFLGKPKQKLCDDCAQELTDLPKAAKILRLKKIGDKPNEM